MLYVSLMLSRRGRITLAVAGSERGAETDTDKNFVSEAIARVRGRFRRPFGGFAKKSDQIGCVIIDEKRKR